MKTALARTFKVQGIPTLVLLNGLTGEVITTEGREKIYADPEGTEFPWAPKCIYELLGDSFVRPDGTFVTLTSLEGKSIGLYFSAHWCPPCRGYTPKLSQMYKDMKAAGRDDFEIIFISSDRDAGAFKEYRGEMPWLALPFEKRAEKEALALRFGVGGIPTLVTLDLTGKVVNKNARRASISDAAGFPWVPRPYAELSEVGAGHFCTSNDSYALSPQTRNATNAPSTQTADCNNSDINQATSLIIVLDGCTAAVQEASTVALQTIAITRAAADKAAGKSVSFLFFSATAEDGPVEPVKDLCKVISTETPVAIILDIPDNGGYYSTEMPEVSVESIGAFLTDYETRKLTRKQLGK